MITALLINRVMACLKYIQFDTQVILYGADTFIHALINRGRYYELNN